MIILFVRHIDSMSHIYKPEANFEFPDGTQPQSGPGGNFKISQNNLID